MSFDDLYREYGDRILNLLFRFTSREQIARDVLLAQHVGSRLHVLHVSTAGSVDLIRWAKSRDIAVTATADGAIIGGMTYRASLLLTASLVSSRSASDATQRADLESCRRISLAAWIARRWEDPMFPATFPWFNTTRYWGEQVLGLREQLGALTEPPLELP